FFGLVGRGDLGDQVLPFGDAGRVDPGGVGEQRAALVVGGDGSFAGPGRRADHALVPTAGVFAGFAGFVHVGGGDAVRGERSQRPVAAEAGDFTAFGLQAFEVGQPFADRVVDFGRRRRRR